MKRFRTYARGRKWNKTMDCDVTPTISMDHIPEEDEPATSVRASAELEEERILPASEMNGNKSDSVESLASTTDVGCSRILGDIQAGLQADINAAKVCKSLLSNNFYTSFRHTCFFPKFTS